MLALYKVYTVQYIKYVILIQYSTYVGEGFIAWRN